MARTKENLRIDISENAAEDMRVITVTIIAPSSKFILADLLRQRGAVANLDAALKEAVRGAIQNYLAGTEDLIARLAAVQKRPENGAKPGVKTQVQGGAKQGTNGTSPEVHSGHARGADKALQEEISGEVLLLE